MSRTLSWQLKPYSFDDSDRYNIPLIPPEQGVRICSILIRPKFILEYIAVKYIEYVSNKKLSFPCREEDSFTDFTVGLEIWLTPHDESDPPSISETTLVPQWTFDSGFDGYGVCPYSVLAEYGVSTSSWKLGFSKRYLKYLISGKLMTPGTGFCPVDKYRAKFWLISDHPKLRNKPFLLNARADATCDTEELKPHINIPQTTTLKSKIIPKRFTFFGKKMLSKPDIVPRKVPLIGKHTMSQSELVIDIDYNHFSPMYSLYVPQDEFLKMYGQVPPEVKIVER